MHDPKVYENPDEFRPERFLKEDGPTGSDIIRDPFDFVFGFGRRYDSLGWHIWAPLGVTVPGLIASS